MNKSYLEVSDKNLIKFTPNKMSNRKLLRNTPKKIKGVYKLFDEFQDGSTINYFEDYEKGKKKTQIVKK